jgi:ArsR family transcriptional regulator
MEKKINPAKLAARANIFKALAHPTRLSILEYLAEREHCVCELLDKINADQTTISKHLALMKNAGILESDRRGTMVFYRIKMKCVAGFMSCVDRAMISNAKEKMKAVS